MPLESTTRCFIIILLLRYFLVSDCFEEVLFLCLSEDGVMCQISEQTQSFVIKCRSKLLMDIDKQEMKYKRTQLQHWIIIYWAIYYSASLIPINLTPTTAVTHDILFGGLIDKLLSVPEPCVLYQLLKMHMYCRQITGFSLLS